jgi:hypothetical protein
MVAASFANRQVYLQYLRIAQAIQPCPYRWGGCPGFAVDVSYHKER